MSIVREKDRVKEAIEELRSACLIGEEGEYGTYQPITRERAAYLVERLRKAVVALLDEREHQNERTEP